MGKLLNPEHMGDDKVFNILDGLVGSIYGRIIGDDKRIFVVEPRTDEPQGKN